jgi:hypothetical protein
MYAFGCIKNNIFRLATALLLIAMLLLSTVSSIFTLPVSANSHSNNTGMSAPSCSYDFALFPSQPQIKYSPYQPNSVSEYAFNKRIPANETLTACQNYESQNNLPRLLGSAPILPNSLHKDIKFFYLSTDIPPPFSSL